MLRHFGSLDRIGRNQVVSNREQGQNGSDRPIQTAHTGRTEAGTAAFEAASEVLCDATGWPIIDCDYVTRLMFEAAEAAR